MSKIQINELNSNSELEVLNTQETAEVVGGYYFDYSKYANVYQFNGNYTEQVAIFGSNYNNTYQSNDADIYQ